ncbi:MAG: DHHW family protein [Erysipelotrichaceae bacterium]
MEKIIAYFTCIAFFIMIISISLFTLFKEPIRFSPLENRNLTLMPSFKWEQVLNNKYQDEIELAFADQILFRDSWAMIEAYGEEMIGKVENNGIYYGKDQYLMERFSTYDEEQMNYNIKQINQFKAKIKQPVSFMLVANSSSVLTDKLPAFHQDIKLTTLHQKIKQQLDDDILFVDPYQRLKQHQKEAIYFKGDHHWNLKGAFYGYQELALRQGRELIEPIPFIQVSDDFKGTMISAAHRYLNKGDSILKLSNNPEVVVQYDQGKQHDVYVEDNLKLKDKYTYYLNGSQARVHIDCGNNKQSNLLIIRDSFANIMLPYLVRDYQSIDVIDLRYDHASMSELIEQNQIDQVLFLYSTKNFVSDKNLVFLK